MRPLSENPPKEYSVEKYSQETETNKDIYVSTIYQERKFDLHCFVVDVPNIL